MKKILYYIGILCFAAFAGCSRGDDQNAGMTESREDMVAVELLPAGVTVSTRALDPLMGTVYNATILVFHDDAADQATYGNVFLRKNLDYNLGERLYLPIGEYKIFVVANLDDSNCPPGSTATTYLDDVNDVDGLTGKYLLASSTSADVLGKMIMWSGLLDLDITAEQTAPLSPTITIPLKRVQSKVDINIYNRCDISGNVLSGVDLLSYNLENLPAASFLDDTDTDYDALENTDLTTISTVSYTVENLSGTYYRLYNIPIYTFENRSGDTTGTMGGEGDRKEYAPETALHMNLYGYTVDGILHTYIYPGKGRTVSTPPDPDIDNFDVDRDCIYHVNVYINGIANISQDSRREYIELFLYGELESPIGGNDWGNF